MYNSGGSLNEPGGKREGFGGGKKMQLRGHKTSLSNREL